MKRGARTAALVVVALATTACGGEEHERRVPRVARHEAKAIEPPPPRAPSTAPSKKRNLSLSLLPEPGTAPRVHVEMVASDTRARTLHIERVAADAVTHVAAKDEDGAIGIKLALAPGLATVAARGGSGADEPNEPTKVALVATLDRAPLPPLHVSYDVAASSDVRARSGETVVADDRFRGFGEGLVLLPDDLADVRLELDVHIDGKAIRAPNAASSFGVGATRTRVARGRALVHSAFLAASMGQATFETGSEHDESAWLGYTAFDPRPVSAEIAEIRTALRDLWKGGDDEAFTILFVSTARPAGAYTMAPRASSLFLQLGPSEAWSPAMRLGVTQHLMHAWIGGALRFASDDPTRADEAWFDEGVARYFAAHALARMGLLAPDDARDFVNGLLIAMIASPHRGKSRAEVAKLAAKDPTARAHLMATGALHALHVASRFAKGPRTKGRSLDVAVLELLERARTTRGAALQESAWTEMLARELGDVEARHFADTVDRGAEEVLPDDLLGPCFRAEKGPIAELDLGFDAEATMESRTRALVGLDPQGPAARAGARVGDVLDEASYRPGHPEVRAALRLIRDGKQIEVSYRPEGPKRSGRIYVRAGGARDETCGATL